MGQVELVRASQRMRLGSLSLSLSPLDDSMIVRSGGVTKWINIDIVMDVGDAVNIDQRALWALRWAVSWPAGWLATPYSASAYSDTRASWPKRMHPDQWDALPVESPNRRVVCGHQLAAESRLSTLFVAALVFPIPSRSSRGRQRFCPIVDHAGRATFPRQVDANLIYRLATSRTVCK